MGRGRRGGAPAAEVVGGDLDAARAGFCAAAAGRAAREAPPGDFRAMALSVKRAMDARWDPVWHVVAGEAFGCFMTCLEGSYCYLRVPPSLPGRPRDTMFVVFRSQALHPGLPADGAIPRGGLSGLLGDAEGAAPAPQAEAEAEEANHFQGDLDDLGSKIQTLRRSISIFVRTPAGEEGKLGHDAPPPAPLVVGVAEGSEPPQAREPASAPAPRMRG